ncbi:MAG TPA: hypothetical protein VFJ65_08120 [Solirubrobacterales bacterium]|nr:hypothetical protein [Solirubrobacterales bacterium]
MKLWISAFAVLALAAFSNGATAAAAASAPPTIANESASNLMPTDATLEAEINPQSAERGVWYQFQVATAPDEFPPEFTCPTEGFPAHSSLCLTVPSQPGALPLRWLPSGTEAEPVSLDLASHGMELQAGVAYYWRVIAAGSIQTIDTIEWEKPAVHGAGKSFETPASAAAPTIEGESVSEVTPTNAILEAQIDPGGLETGYKFHLEYGCGISPEEVCPFYCLPEWEACSLITSIPLPEGHLPPSSEAESVGLALNESGVSLQPNTKYRYWVEATNGAGAAEGSKKIFTTPTEEPEGTEKEVEGPTEEPEATEPPLQGDPPGALQGEETGPIPPSPTESSSQPPPKATHCRRAPRRHRAKHHRHHRIGIDKACRGA